MAASVFSTDDLARKLLGGLVLLTRSSGGRDLEYLRGALAMGQYVALLSGVEWVTLLSGARRELGTDGLDVLDSLDSLNTTGRALPMGDR